MMRPLSVLLPAGLAVLAGCSLSPHYERPPVADPAASYKEAGEWKLAAPADAVPRGNWWSMYHDADLDGLEEQLGATNQSLRAGLARLEQARAQARGARAGYFPQLTVGASATRARTSLNSPAYVPGKPATSNLYIASADLSYEIDVFGRVRSSVAVAHASEQASAGDLAALDLALHAELARDYFTLRGLDIEQRLLEQTVSDYQRALELTENLFHGGAAAVADVQQAQALLESARTQTEDTRLQRAQTEHAIAVLVGREAPGFSLPSHAEPPELPVPAFDPGIPSQLLERRPDVAAAERRVAAANAGIGVARAAYFPVFNLLGTVIGAESTQASNWISAPSEFWALGPTALFTLFDGGLHRAQSAAAHAVYDEQVADYRGTVLTAFQEVEDELAALRQLERESVSQAAAVKATQGAAEQANLRYKGGIVTYLEVVTTQHAALEARLTAVDIDIRRTNATVLLVKALGGDWHPPGG